MDDPRYAKHRSSVIIVLSYIIRKVAVTVERYGGVFCTPIVHVDETLSVEVALPYEAQVYEFLLRWLMQESSTCHSQVGKRNEFTKS